MPIIDDINYNSTVHNKITHKIFIPISQTNASRLSGIRKMLRFDNNIRPRRNGINWLNSNQSNLQTTTTIFRIGEVYKDYNDKDFAISLNSDKNSETKYNKKDHSEVKKSIGKKFLKQITNYCDKTTLHGLRYVGDTSLSLGERIFWAIAFISAIGFAAYYISNIYRKWNMNPIIIGFSPFDVTLEAIPFPAITICNMNQAKKSEADRILKEGSNMEKKLLSDICTTKNTYINNTGDIVPNWSTVRDFTLKVSQSCSDMLKSCQWRSIKVNCEEYFNNDLTDEGLCCSFNRLPPTNIFKNPADIPTLNQTYRNFVYDWTPEKGFTDTLITDESYIPLRAFGAGTHLGLSLVLDVQAENYYCSSTNSLGFKIILANPIETPKVTDYAFLVSPGTEGRYIIKPSITESTVALRSIPIETRQCYFSNERQLRYYRTYTQKNCRLECQSNYTLQMCGCIPYFLPRNKLEKVCGKVEQTCVDQAKLDMEYTFGNGTSCYCLSGCFEMSFTKSSSFSKLSKIVTSKHDIGNVSANYFVDNMAVAHFFFENSKFRKQIKNELYGFTEVLSNVGGLLGLCLGFSFLSLIELIYYLTLRICCLGIRAHNKRQKKISNNSSSGVVYPFTK